MCRKKLYRACAASPTTGLQATLVIRMSYVAVQWRRHPLPAATLMPTAMTWLEIAKASDIAISGVATGRGRMKFGATVPRGYESTQIRVSSTTSTRPAAEW